MTLKDKLEQDLKAALKSRDAETLGTVRLVLAAVKNEELAKRKELGDAEVIGVLSSLAKQRGESIEAFEKAGRDELAAKEKGELAVLKRYLPEALSSDELERLVEEAIAESGAASPKDMGKVMKILAPKTKGRADGKAVSELVKEKLS
jgi:uncharacterized protein YqeY